MNGELRILTNVTLVLVHTLQILHDGLCGETYCDHGRVGRAALTLTLGFKGLSKQHGSFLHPLQANREAYYSEMKLIYLAHRKESENKEKRKKK